MSEDIFEAALTSLGLKKFEVPAPKLGNAVHLFQIFTEQARTRLAGISDEYVEADSFAFGFAEHRAFNAFAHRTSKDIICLYSTPLRVLWSFFNAMMDNRQIFPWVDDVEVLGGTAPAPKGDLFFLRETLPLDAAGAPFNPIRPRLARALFDVAADFLLLHELGHLRNGHVALLQQRAGARPFRELPYEEADKLEIPEAQALEFDADGFAVQKVFERVYKDNPFLEFSKGLLKDHRLAEDGVHTASWYFTWFAVYSVFRLFDEAMEISEIPLRMQPPAALRQACLLPAVAAMTGRSGWSGLSLQEWVDLATDAGLEAERTLTGLRRMKPDPHAYLQAWNGGAFDQIGLYLDTWETLGPQLAPLRRGATLVV
ncbi:hypothetical protein [Methylovirgula sp. HY1]|uniref:hypothetical protein n=1 Tax=Methylovirgula sp. HY1 TaxID=2822761 RepID=UPI001C5BB524|nr:hypothetical protein [Methylovirgula sp. HY1]QXX75764.1 hypothetical protein MHY1_02595 [Methylovirgula sp. HY1]